MKKLFILFILLIHYSILHAQNVGIGTTNPAGKLHIKGSADISQLTIDAGATQSNTNPLIRLRNAAGVDLLHIYSDGTTNTFVGLNAGRVNNAAGGGTNNTFIGSLAGSSNTTGYYNIATGSTALSANTSGHGNIAYGFQALLSNTTGNYNIAIGPSALRDNSTGDFNTAVGLNSLDFTTASKYNTALGFSAGSLYDNGYNNLFLGANVDVDGPGYYNVIAIGQGTICTGSSQVTMGNGATGSYRAYANWSNISDGRFKKNIQENVPGLAFINKLQAVSYNIDAAGLDAFMHKNDNNTNKAGQQSLAAKSIYSKALQEKEKLTCTGFIAQDVEKAAKELGFDFSGVDAPKNNNDVYALRYADFVVPLVKAVQEQQAIINDLQKQIDELKALIKNK